MVAQLEQGGVVFQDLDHLHLGFPSADVPLVLKAQLGQRGVVLQRLDERQDALPGEMVGVEVNAGDSLVAADRAGNGISDMVVCTAVSESERLDVGVVVQSFCKLDERFRLDDL